MALFNKRQLVRKALSHSGGMNLLQRIPVWNGLVVLNYHRIGRPDDSPLDHALWSATVEDFDAQVQEASSCCDVIGLADLPQAMADLKTSSSRRSASLRFAMITFDDGYRDNFELALPVLRTHGVPGVFFITTGFLDDHRLAWWDEIAWMVENSRCDRLSHPGLGLSQPIDLSHSFRRDAIPRLLRHYYSLDGSQTGAFIEALAEATGSGRAPASVSQDLWMTWDMVRLMHATGMSIGAHTVNHPVMSRFTASEQSDEILTSRLRLEAELGTSVTAFSYPVGSREAFNSDTRQALIWNDMDWAFSYYGGYVTDGSMDRFDIPRVAVESCTSLEDFRSFLSLPQLFTRH